jgi:hypothetical protein
LKTKTSLFLALSLLLAGSVHGAVLSRAIGSDFVAESATFQAEVRPASPIAGRGAAGSVGPVRISLRAVPNFDAMKRH